MTKNELIAFMSEKAGLKKTEAAKALEAVFEGITETLKKGQKVQIVGFGTFETRERAARVGFHRLQDEVRRKEKRQKLQGF